MDNLTGALLMIAAMAFFATEDVFVKFATQTLPVGEVLAVIGILGACSFSLIAAKQGHSVFSKQFFHPMVILRNLGEMAGTLCFVLGITVVSLGLVTALFQATPLFVNLGAIVFLGATVGWRRWIAIVVGFIGVMVILRPGFEGFEMGALFGLGAALGLAVRDLATRQLPREIPTTVISAWGFLSVAPAGAALMALGDGPVVPNLQETGFMLAATLLGMIGYFALVRAMQAGEIAIVTPFRYTRLIFALILAFMVFDEAPDAMTVLGAGLIVAAGLFVLIRERHQLRAKRVF
ncbi:MAG: DMT family transporter [Maritimibacter sp.]